MRILLDMDGVVADFVTGVATLMGTPDKGTFGGEVPHTWDLHHAFGTTRTTLMNRIRTGGQGFWQDLRPLPWAPTLWDLVAAADPHWTYCTAPILGAECPAGKVAWMEAQHGRGWNRYIITNEKTLCARPDTLLIDDRDTTVEAFRAAGGHAFLWPMPWNAGRSTWTVDGRAACRALATMLGVRS